MFDSGLKFRPLDSIMAEINENISFLDGSEGKIQMNKEII
jgi:hypothetical protein